MLGFVRSIFKNAPKNAPRCIALGPFFGSAEKDRPAKTQDAQSTFIGVIHGNPHSKKNGKRTIGMDRWLEAWCRAAFHARGAMVNSSTVGATVYAIGGGPGRAGESAISRSRIAGQLHRHLLNKSNPCFSRRDSLDKTGQPAFMRLFASPASGDKLGTLGT